MVQLWLTAEPASENSTGMITVLVLATSVFAGQVRVVVFKDTYRSTSRCWLIARFSHAMINQRRSP
jgi:hypothetical protein